MCTNTGKPSVSRLVKLCIPGSHGVQAPPLRRWRVRVEISGGGAEDAYHQRTIDLLRARRPGEPAILRRLWR